MPARQEASGDVAGGAFPGAVNGERVGATLSNSQLSECQLAAATRRSALMVPLAEALADLDSAMVVGSTSSSPTLGVQRSAKPECAPAAAVCRIFLHAPPLALASFVKLG